ncbi:WD40/YVTN/BNR-like repeat-containing protein [Roseateles cellulosilyticus]|uniref:YCF48-related protein n=1 Tax=Pelomonas cellulosilytica TaxID=2906762 RepID=A0ABS8Y114_9BURK|nr:YCF48-related protein [Pelomonas sp. P8]MCE4556596.1 YCF48-related protein [Pelomonas sp. P8]
MKLWFLAAAFAASSGTAAPVVDALDRPAIAVRRPEAAVLSGAAMAGTRIVAVGERGIVTYSDDAAATWAQAASPVSVTLTAVRFADSRRGYAIGHGGVVLATRDAGASWQRVLDGRQVAAIAVKAAEASGDEARMREAQRLVADGADKPLLDLLVLDSQRVIIVGAYGLALETEDGGQSWQPWMNRLDNPKGLHLYAIRSQGDTMLIAGEQGLALLSGDGGRSFRRLPLPYGGSFFTAELSGPNEILLSGLRGNVWQTTDGGASWRQLSVPVAASITASARTGDGRVLLASQAGLVLTAGQAAALPLSRKPLPPLNGLLPLGDRALLALSVQGAITVSVQGATARRNAEVQP